MASTKESGHRALQRREALRRAHEVRRRRAELKQALRVGAVDIAELLDEPPDWLLSARLSEILLAVPGYGRVRVARLLERFQISPRRMVGELSERQRTELGRHLRAAEGPRLSS